MPEPGARETGASGGGVRVAAPSSPTGRGEGERRGGAVRSRTDREVARRLVEAGVALSSARSLDDVLQALADAARDLVDARYAALGVIDEAGTGLSNFITSGLNAEQRERLGKLPTGHGILGLLIRDARPIRLRDLREHPDSAGVPAHHPSMRSFLGVPVQGRGRIFGNLYVTEKLCTDEFDDDDVSILEMLASQAAVAIENTELRRERERFFAAVSHELGNVIAGVNLWARVLLRNPPDEVEEWTRGVAGIHRGAEDAQRLIEDLLSLSKLQEGRLHLSIDRVDAGEVAEAVIERFRPDAEAASLTLEVAPRRQGVPVMADPARLRQVLVNLVGNALKFTPAGGRIELDIESAEADVVFCVRDTGPGIEEAEHERIFLPYEQIESIAHGRGIGLGLPLSRRLARLMDGDLWVESTPGKGATFKLRLPSHPRKATS